MSRLPLGSNEGRYRSRLGEVVVKAPVAARDVVENNLALAEPLPTHPRRDVTFHVTNHRRRPSAAPERSQIRDRRRIFLA